MENSSSQGKKIPLIVIGVAIVVIAAGIFMRTRKSPQTPVAPKSEPASVSAPKPASELASEPKPVAAQPNEPEPQIEFDSLTATDDNGDTWQLGLQGIPPQLPEGCTKSGTPLVVKADVLGDGQYISIGLVIQGQAGEVYEPGATKNGRMLPAPTFRVFDESGKLIGNGSFEYG